MKVRVLYFANLRERRGVAEEELEIEPGTTLAALYASLFPAGPDGRIPVAYTRNRAVSPGSTPIEPGDEVSFLPPLGGG
ncbi:MAG: MoaD/ThiS family protein [Alphaproteobacteria bacterium]|nr:MoaD/ThiS family protein [Alphaproteobacteria bacterium]